MLGNVLRWEAELKSLVEHLMVMFGLGGGENAALDLGLFSLCICSYFRDVNNSLTASFRVFMLSFWMSCRERSFCSWLITLAKLFFSSNIWASGIYRSSQQTCAAFIYTPSFKKVVLLLTLQPDAASIFSSTWQICLFVVSHTCSLTKFSLQIDACSTSLH